MASSEWNMIDLGAAATIIAVAGLCGFLIHRKVKHKSWRAVLFAGLILLLILVWMELAVGIFGTAIQGN